MSVKKGLHPGSLIYTGRKKEIENTVYDHYFYNDECYEKIEADSKIEKVVLKNVDGINWINLKGINNPRFIEEVGLDFEVDTLTLEDILNTNQRPKIDIRENYIFITLRSFNYDNQELENEQISIILFKGGALSFQEEKNQLFEVIESRIKYKIGRVRGKGSGYLGYALIDVIIDNYFLLVDKLEEELTDLEKEIIESPDTKVFEKILRLKQEVTKMRRAVTPLREFASKIRFLEELEENDISIFLEDLRDHIVIVTESLEGTFHRSTDLMDLYQSMVGNKMNEIMKFLTLVSSIFIPISFLAGVYGMNFINIPGLSYKYGYFVLVGVMVGVVGWMVYLFKRKKWW